MIFTQKMIAFNTIVGREFKRTFRLWAQTLLPAAVTTTLYFLIFGHLIGRRIGTMANLPYLDFIVPGLIMMTMLTASFSAAVSTVFSAKFNHSIEEILISPMTPRNILMSFMCVGIIRRSLCRHHCSYNCFLFYSYKYTSFYFYAVYCTTILC